MVPGRRHTGVLTVFPAHLRRPTLRLAERLRDRRIVEGALQNPPHVFVRPRERRKVGDTEAQDLCHIVLLPKDRSARIGFGRTRNKHRSPGPARAHARFGEGSYTNLLWRQADEGGICRGPVGSLRSRARSWQEAIEITSSTRHLDDAAGEPPN